MNIRHYLPRLIAITAVAFLTTTSSCFGTRLLVTLYLQEETKWCWNASCQMVLAFKGHSCSQKEIADWAVDGENVGSFLFDSPDPDRAGCDEVLSYFGNISSLGTYAPMSMSALENEMLNMQPVIINWKWDSGEGGHAVVLCGTIGSSVYVNDPLRSHGESVQDYSWVCRPYNLGTWDKTLQIYGGSATDYDLSVYYGNLSSKYLTYWDANRNSPYTYYYLAYAYYYAAYSSYYHWMYYNGNKSYAMKWYNYYMDQALFYYEVFQNQSLYRYYYVVYNSYAMDYYSDYQKTGDYLSLAYACYYYAYRCYCSYMYNADKTSAIYYYNYWMKWATFIYENYC